jgi:uncharacterized membrane protein YecN with MAPEG domain
MDKMDQVDDVEAPIQASDELPIPAPAPVSELLNGRAKRLSKRAQRRQDESSNAVESPNYFVFLDKRLNTAEGGATWLTWLLRFIGVEQFVMHYVGMTHIGFIGGALTANNTLFVILFSSFAIAELVSCTLLLDSLRRVIRPGEHLQTMGAGRVKLSARAVRSLRRLRLGLRVPQAFFVVVGSFFVVFTMSIVLSAHDQTLYNRLIFAFWFAVWGLWFALVVPLLLEWWLTLSVASALAADAVLEVVTAAETIAPTESEWTEKIAEPAKHLALDTMDELTHGWGRALAVAYGLYWMLSLGALAGGLAASPSTFSDIFLALSFAFSVLPLAMSTDPAAVSSSCDDMLAELNSKRCELFGQPDAVANLILLEDYLNTLNERQG